MRDENPTEDPPPGRKGEHYNETLGNEPCEEEEFEVEEFEEEFDPEEAERRITQFVSSANELAGPRVEELAEQVAALMRAAMRDIEQIMEGKALNKVLATQLLLSQRARALVPNDPEQWQLYAASTLLSEMVVR